jgi:hypothetical protein
MNYLGETKFCQLSSEAPGGYGPNFTSRALDPCEMEHCELCKNNNLQCNQCWASQGYYMNTWVEPYFCILFSDISDGLGPNLVSKELDLCAVDNCQKCKTDVNVCTQCWTNESYYLNALQEPNVCQQKAEIGNGFGVNVTSLRVEACVVNHCRLCKDDVNVCDECQNHEDQTLAYYLNKIQEPNVCQLASEIADGFGPNLTSLRVEPCATDFCQKCSKKIDICDKCLTSGGYFANTTAAPPYCQHWSTAAAGSGANLTSFKLEACKDPACFNCGSNVDLCSQCKTEEFYYFNKTDVPYCQLSSTAAPGYGPNLSSFEFERCSDLNCYDCHNDKSVCIRCNVAAGYFMNLTSNLCQLGTTVADGFGINSGDGIFEACQTENCQKCVNDYTVCTRCDSSKNYFMNTTADPNYCQLASNSEDGYGPNPGSFNLEPCLKDHCQNCRTNYSTCSQCKIAQNYYWNTTGEFCQEKSTISERFGVNRNNFHIEPCEDTCQICLEDITICTHCRTSAGYYMNTSTETCQHFSTSADGFGINSAEGVLDNCKDPGCMQCVDDYENCTRCDAFRDFFMNTTNYTCQKAEFIIDGFGVNMTSQAIEPCAGPGCQRCMADIFTCTLCNASQAFFMNTTTKVCQTLSTMEKGYRVANNSVFERCADNRCRKCDADRNVCELCLSEDGFYMNISSKICESGVVQPPGVGIDTKTVSFKKCEDPHCFNCSLNFSNCTWCDTAQDYFMNLTTKECQLQKNASKGFRSNSSLGAFEKCKVRNCSVCENDVNVCETCNEEAGYSLLGERCVLPKTNSPIQQTAKFSASDSKAVVKFSNLEFQASWADQLDIMLLDLSANKSYTDQKLFKVFAKESGFEVAIFIDTYIETARIYITKKEILVERRILQTNSETTSSDSNISSASNSTNETLEKDTNTVPEDLFPVIIENFTLLNEKSQRMIAGAAASVVESMDTQRAVANIVLMNVNMNAATLLDRLLADYEYQALIGKQNLTYTRLLLDPALEVKLAPFDLPGTDKETKEGALERKMRYECSLEYFYFRNQVKCNFLNNYGSDFITLVFFLVVNSLIFTLGFLLRRKGYLNDDLEEPAKGASSREVLMFQLNKIGCMITVTFGLQFFFIKMETNAIKILLFALLNIYKMDGSWQMSVGFAISLLIVAYYSAYVYFAWMFANGLKKAIIQSTREKTDKGKYLKGPLKTSMKMHLIKFGFMSKPYEELRNDLNFFEIYYPVVLILRDISISLSIVMLTSRPHISPILTAVTEFLLFVYCSATRTRQKKVENAMDIFNSICRLVFSVLAALTFSYDKIPVTLDILMFLSLLLNTLGCLFLMAYITMLEVYSILVLIFSKSVMQGRFKTSEDRIKEKFDPKFLKFRTEVLEAIEINPARIIKRLDQQSGKNSSTNRGLALVDGQSRVDNDSWKGANAGSDIDENNSWKDANDSEIDEHYDCNNANAGSEVDEYIESTRKLA